MHVGQTLGSVKASEQQDLKSNPGQQREEGIAVTGLAGSGHNQIKLEVRGPSPFTPPGAQCRRHDVGYPRKGRGMGHPPSAWGRASATVPISVTGIEISGILLEARVEGHSPSDMSTWCGYCQQAQSHMQSSL